MINRCIRTWFAACVITTIAFADGLALKYRPDLSAVRPLAENEQMAIIAHRDGRQRMLLAVSFDDLKTDDRAVWIVPVPGKPNEVKIDVADEMPRIVGRRVDAIADEAREIIASIAAVFAVVPICFMIPSLNGPRGFASEHMEVNKHGLRLATVTAANPDELIAYFQSHEVKVEADMLRSLEPYMNDRFTFVVGWIASRADLLRDYPELDRDVRYPELCPGFRIDFPSDLPFFPLAPTSYYGESNVPLRLIVLGFHQLPANIGWSSHRTRWCRTGGIRDVRTCEFFQIAPNAPFDYTVINTDVAAREYTRDLRLEPANSRELRSALWTINNVQGPLVAVYVIVVVAVCSYLAGGLTGLLFFGHWHHLALFGLTNLLSVLGMMFCVGTVNFGKISSWWPDTHENVKRRCFVAGFVIVYPFTIPLVGYPLLRLIA